MSDRRRGRVTRERLAGLLVRVTQWAHVRSVLWLATEQALYEALDCKTENFRFTERLDALERLAIVAAVAAKGRTGGYWTEMHEILGELEQ